MELCGSSRSCMIASPYNLTDEKIKFVAHTAIETAVYKFAGFGGSIEYFNQRYAKMISDFKKLDQESISFSISPTMYSQIGRYVDYPQDF